MICKRYSTAAFQHIAAPHHISARNVVVAAERVQGRIAGVFLTVVVTVLNYQKMLCDYQKSVIY